MYCHQNAGLIAAACGQLDALLQGHKLPNGLGTGIPIQKVNVYQNGNVAKFAKIAADGIYTHY